MVNECDMVLNASQMMVIWWLILIHHGSMMVLGWLNGTYGQGLVTNEHGDIPTK